MMNKSYTVLIVTITVALAVLLAPLSNAAAKDTKPGVFDSAVTWYVNYAAMGANTGSSWADAFTRLQSALEQAQSGDQIWVAQGIYTPTNTTDRTAAFNMMPGVAVYGGFAGTETQQAQRSWKTHVTVLSGDLDGNDLTDPNGVLTSTAGILGENAYHVVISRDLTQTARLDGFYVTGGNTNGDSTTYGGGMLNWYSSPNLTNVTFSANHAQWGGGMYNYTSSSNRLVNVTFIANNADYDGGGVFNDLSDSSFIQVTFYANQAGQDGGGILNRYSSSSLVNTTFFDNWASRLGGGMHNSSSSPSLANVTFSANQAGYYGGGMANVYSNPSLVNVTLVANWASYGGGGIYNFGNTSSPTVSNSLLWGNSALSGSQIYSDNDSAITLSFSTVQGGCPAGSTCKAQISADPLFVRLPSPGADGVWRTADDDPGNLHVLFGSPAINAGSNALLPADTLDLDGDGDTSEALPLDAGGLPRLNGSAVDLGAYEAYWLCLPLISG